MQPLHCIAVTHPNGSGLPFQGIAPHHALKPESHGTDLAPQLPRFQSSWALEISRSKSDTWKPAPTYKS